MHPKDAEGIANSVDPDQTAPLGAVWSGSALFANTYLSENLGKLWYSVSLKFSLILTGSWEILKMGHFTHLLDLFYKMKTQNHSKVIVHFGQKMGQMH